MIDYEKLKIATELVAKIHLGRFHMALSTHDGIEYRFYAPINQSLYTNCLDELIEYLNKFNKHEPKYKVGQHVWLLSHSEGVVEWSIDRIDMRPGHGYFFGDYSYSETELFSTRQALIEHQLKHWRDMLSEELEQDISPYCEPIQQCKKDNCDHLWVHGKCFDCEVEKEQCKTCKGEGDMRLYAGLGKYKRCNDCNPETQSKGH